jgi:hypothetical protein
MEPSLSDLERSFYKVREGKWITNRYDDMWPILYENLFKVRIRRITSAVESLLHIVCPYGSD